MRLRPVDYGDVERMVEWRTAQMEHLRSWEFPSIDTQNEFIARVHTDPSLVYLAVGGVSDHRNIVAYGGFINIDHINRKAEMAFLGDPEIDTLTEDIAANLILQYGFQTLNLNRIEMETHTGERGELVSSLKFKYEGTKQSSCYRDGQYHDSEMWAFLNYDYSR